MRKNVCQAMDALFSGKNFTSPSIFTNQFGETRPGADNHYSNDIPTVYSYGPHFPLVILDGELAYVNTEKYSATTEYQQSGVATYLYYEGYEPTGAHLTAKGYERFAIYRKVTAERWPGGHYSGMFDRPAHNGVQP